MRGMLGDRGLVVAALAAVTVVGCQGSVDQSLLSVGDDGTVDITRLGDLSIYGRLQVEDGEPVDGPLDLVRLQLSLLTECWDELVVSGDPAHQAFVDVCSGDFQSEESCHDDICAQQLYLCLGLKNQELAETLVPVDFTVKPFEPDAGFGAAIMPDGSYDLRLSPEGLGYARDDEDHHYTIPPQAAPNQTLLWRAATFAYREAGIRSVLAADECSWALDEGGPLDPDVITVVPVSSRHPEAPPSIADIFATGFAEVAERLAETGVATSENERSVAATLPGEVGTVYEARQRQWQGEVNSQAAALALMVASSNLGAARRVARPVVVDGERGATRAAISLLRAGAVDISTDDPGRGDEAVMREVVEALNPNMRSADPAALDVAADRMVRGAGSTWADVSLARRYLLEERAALFRVATPVEPDAAWDGPQQYTGLHEPWSQIDPGALFALAAAAPHNLLRGRSAFDLFGPWNPGGSVYVNANVFPGPGENGQTGESTGDLVDFLTGGSLAQEVSSLPEGCEALVFSVYVQGMFAPNGQPTLELALSTDTASSVHSFQPVQGTWQRVSVTVSGEGAARSALVEIRAPSGGSVALWGAQLEEGLLAGRLGPGVDETVEVESREYMEMGVRQTLDAMRSAAVGLRDVLDPHLADGARAASSVPREDVIEYAGIADSVVRQGPGYAGGCRYTADHPTTLDGTMSIALAGAQPSDRLTLVRGIEGARCLTEGMIDGAPCEGETRAALIVARPADFAATSARAAAGDDPLASTMSATLSLADHPDLTPGTDLFLVRDRQIVAGHRVRTSGGSTITPACIQSIPDFQELPPRRRNNAAEPLDVPCDPWMTADFVPPLENEITEDNDSYENSWRHYLDMAERTAQVADGLGEELVAYGLEMDLRAEAAREELAELCGAQVDDDGQEDCGDDPTCEGRLASCLGSDDERSDTYRIPYVSLGGPLCFFEHATYGVCRCDERDPDCPAARCPRPVEDEATAADCLATFQAMGLGFELEPGEENPYEGRFVGEEASLNVFSPEERYSDSELDCSRLHELRAEAYALGRDDEDGQRAIADELRGMDWINVPTLAAAARVVRLEPRYPNHFALTINGRRMADTFVNAGDLELGSPCPRIFPWRAGEAVSVPDYYCAPGTLGGDVVCSEDLVSNDRIVCASPYDVSGPGSYTTRWREAFEEYGLERVYWAEHVGWALGYLEVLGGVSEVQIPAQGPPLPHLRFWQDAAVEGGYGDDLLAGLPIVTGTLLDESGLPQGEPAYGVLVDCCDPRWEGLSDCDGYDEGCGRSVGLLANDGWALMSRRYTRREGISSESLNRIWESAVYEDLSEGSGALLERAGDHYLYGPFITALRNHGVSPSSSSLSAYSDYPTPTPAAHRAGLWNALELACWVLEQGQPGCPTEALALESLDDVDDAADVLYCTRDAIHRDMQRQVVANIPRGLVENFERAGTEGLYPGYAGEQLDAMLSIEQGLRRFSTGARLLEDTLGIVAQDIRGFRARVRIVHIEEQEAVLNMLEEELHAYIGLAEAATQAVSEISVLQPGSWSAAPTFVALAAADLAVTTAMNDEMEDLVEAQRDAEVELALSDLSRSLADHLSDMSSAYDDMQRAYEEVQSGLGQLERIEDRAAMLLPRVTFEDTDARGRSWSVNTVMRRRENTVRRRYASALRDAKRAAFLARRAIEFRLGERMDAIETDLTLVEAPSQWADGLCVAHADGGYGFDYDEISDPAALPRDDYRHAYIGDYVTKLRSFVESYPIDFPFSDSRDVTAISLRELAASQPLACRSEEASPNLLYFSDDLGGSRARGEDESVLGWTRAGCVAVAGEDQLIDTCMAVRTEDADSAAGCSEGMPCFVGDLLEDTAPSAADPYSPRPPNATSSGRVRQRVEGVERGTYRLSYWVRRTPLESGDEEVPYAVAVLADGVEDELVAPDARVVGDDEWSRVEVYFDVEGSSADLTVEIHPSADACEVVDPADPCEDGLCTVANEDCDLGAIWIAETQLERIPSYECEDADDCAAVGAAYRYFGTDDSRGLTVQCDDPTSLAFQQIFERRCQRDDGRSCDPDYDAGCSCFRELAFPILLDQIESGQLFQSEPIASRNYNYRHIQVALNLQGTDVLACGPDAPASCYSNGFVPYTLEHSGADMPVRTWSGQTVLFDMPTGRIQHGKALAAEVVPTNPLSSAQRNLFQDYWKPELRGRPLQGLYRLRIMEVPGLQWWNLEDVQLVLDYRYWTRFGE